MAIVTFGIYLYGILQLLKFFISATISDVKSHFTDNWYSDERERENNRHLLQFGKFVLAFVVGTWLYSHFGW